MQRSLVCLIATLCLLPFHARADENGATTRPSGPHIRLVGAASAATVEMRVPTDGTIDEIHVKQGQRVRRGDLLFKMDSRHEQVAMELAHAQLDSAHASLELAKTTLAASKDRQNTTLSMEADVRKAEAAVQAAQAQLKGAQLNIEEKTLVSPMDGVLTDYAIEPGQYVRKGAALTSVLRTDPMTIEFEIPASQLYLISTDHEVQIYTSNDRNDPPLLGKIDYIAPRVNRDKGTILIKALLPSTGKLLDGMPVMVEIARRP